MLGMNARRREKRPPVRSLYAYALAVNRFLDLDELNGRKTVRACHYDNARRPETKDVLTRSARLEKPMRS
jgi:hypothetical protein